MTTVMSSHNWIECMCGFFATTVTTTHQFMLVVWVWFVEKSSMTSVEWHVLALSSHNCQQQQCSTRARIILMCVIATMSDCRLNRLLDTEWLFRILLFSIFNLIQQLCRRRSRWHSRRKLSFFVRWTLLVIYQMNRWDIVRGMSDASKSAYKYKWSD